MKFFSARLRLLGAGLLAFLGVTGAGWGYHALTSTVSSQINLSMQSTQASTVTLGSASYSPKLTYGPLTLSDGTGNYQFKIVYADSGSIAASDSVLRDLAGSQADAFGTTITCVTMKVIFVTADSSNVNDVMVGGAGAAAVNFLGVAAADTLQYVPVGPGGAFFLSRPKTGTTVTGGSRDKIRLKNSAGTSAVKYKMKILCR